MTRLTSRHATVAGWRLERTPTGRMRVVDPDGRKYAPTDRRRGADVLIRPRMRGVKPLYLKRVGAPLRLRDLRSAEEQAAVQ